MQYHIVMTYHYDCMYIYIYICKYNYNDNYICLVEPKQATGTDLNKEPQRFKKNDPSIPGMHRNKS